MKKRFLSILLVLCMVLCLLPAAAFAAGSTASADITGTGASDDPYLIYKAAGLKAFRDKANGQNGLTKQPGAHAKLMNDIVLNDGTFDKTGNWSEDGTPNKWTPINGYAGTFDGNGYTIRGLYVKDEGNAGLFTSLSGSAVVKNLTVAGSVEASNTDDNAYAGGIAARMGGNAQIIGCVNNAAVKATVNNDVDAVCTAYVGGMAGHVDGSARITGCTNNGTVAADSNMATAYTGGMAGYTEGGVIIENCLNTAELSAVASGSFYLSDGVTEYDNIQSRPFAGGMVGRVFDVTITGCFNTGAVTARGTGNHPQQPNAGGMIGLANGGSITVTDCGNTGKITASRNERGSVAGGIVGSASETEGTAFSISYCYSTGEVPSDHRDSWVGGIAGGVSASQTYTISDCYWLTGSCGNGVDENFNSAASVTKVEAFSKSDFANGTVLELLKQNDTNNVWDVCGYLEAAGMTLPLLKWQTLNARKYDISVVDKDGNAVQITSLNQNDVLGDGTVSFVYDDANEKGTLTLNGAELSSEYEFPIDASDMENLEIVLKGKSKISTEATCIIAKNLTFSGEGSLEITNLYFYAVDCTGAVTVNGGNIKIDSPDSALCFDGAFTVNGGTVELIGAASTAIVPAFTDPVIILGDDRIMIAGRFYDGSDAQVTAVSDADAISVAKYVKILGKYIPIVYDPGQYGTGDAVTQNKTYGEDFGLSDALFTRVGYKQTSWTTAENGGEILRLGSAYSGNEPLKLYPVWEIEQYDITYDLDGGTVTGNPDSYSIESEGFTLNNPEREGGYEFAGWSGTDLEGNDNMTVTVPTGSTGNRNYTAHWRDIQVPVINGLEDGKTYCSAVEFTATDNDGEPTVTVNGTVISAEGGKYTLLPAQGTQTVVVTDNAGNRVEVTVTVNDGHTHEWQSENGQYWQKCKFCGFETDKKDIPTISINGTDEVCRTQDYTYTFTISEDCPFVIGGYTFENLGDDLTATQENGLYTATVGASCYQIDENSFKVTVLAETADGYAFGAEKTVNILDQHIGGTATCTEKAKCDVCGEEYGELDSDNHTGEAEWIKTDKTHEKKYTCCGAVEIAESAHEYDNDSDATCNICGYERKIELTTTAEPTTAEKTTAASTPSDKPVNTGAESAMGLALFMAAGAIGMISAKRRRK